MTETNNKFSIRILWLFVIATLLSGCATLSDGVSQKENQMAREEILIRDRVTARWDAFLAGEFEKVYGFASPTYRKTYDFRHFSNQYAMQIQRTGIEIYKVEFDPEDPNIAKVVVLLSFLTEGSVGHIIEGQSRVVETWIKQNGQWWHVERR